MAIYLTKLIKKIFTIYALKGNMMTLISLIYGKNTLAGKYEVNVRGDTVQ